MRMPQETLAQKQERLKKIQQKGDMVLLVCCMCGKQNGEFGEKGEPKNLRYLGPCCEKRESKVPASHFKELAEIAGENAAALELDCTSCKKPIRDCACSGRCRRCLEPFRSSEIFSHYGQYCRCPSP